jgi:hypothetical protein
MGKGGSQSFGYPFIGLQGPLIYGGNAYWLLERVLAFEFERTCAARSLSDVAREIDSTGKEPKR